MPKKQTKKKPKKLKNIDRPRNGGQWTEARFVSFVKSALRGARWPQKYQCIKDAYIEDGINPATGRKCKLHECPQCNGTFPQNQMHADHIIPVVGPEGFQTWDMFIERLFVEADGFQAMCKECHKRITKHETNVRKETKNKQINLL